MRPKLQMKQIQYVWWHWQLRFVCSLSGAKNAVAAHFVAQKSPFESIDVNHSDVLRAWHQQDLAGANASV